MRSVVTGVAKALVERVRRRARGGGWACLAPGPLRPPLRGHGATPSGAVTTLMVAVAPWVRKPLL
jgi:hypothetical protein